MAGRFEYFSSHSSKEQKILSRNPRIESMLQWQRGPILKQFKGQLDQLSHAQKIDRLVINSVNFNQAREYLAKLLKNREHVEQNLHLSIGDKVIWNEQRQELFISDKFGGFKFSIRFTPFSAKEKKARTPEKISKKTLGDWIVANGPFPGKNKSCGASCGSLLNMFGFKKILPQSGRDGKNWDTIIEQYASEFFKKIPVNHPDEAPAGSILVFNEGAAGAKGARKSFGHVEIKGSDGMYYSYYKSKNAGGSVVSNDKNPQSYKKYTGFTGYAYVHNGKIPS